MSTLSRIMVTACALGAGLGMTSVRAANAPGASPDDDAMTCEQIATELSPYVQQMVPNIQAFGATTQQMYDQSRPLLEKRKMEHTMLAPLATAGGLDPTGASKRAYMMATMAQTAKEKAENEAIANSPLARENRAQGEQVAAQAQQMQSSARLQRLMQLAQQKKCDKR